MVAVGDIDFSVVLGAEALQKGLRAIRPGMDPHAPLQALASVLIEAMPGGVALSATTIDEGIQITLPASAEQGGVQLVPFRELVRALPASGEVELRGVGHGLEVRGSGHRRLLPTLEANIIPPLQWWSEDGVLGEVPTSAWRDGIRRALLAVSPTSWPASRRCPWLTVTAGQAELAGTDGHSLIVTQIPGALTDLRLPLVLGAANILRQASAFLDETLRLSASKDRLWLRSGQVQAFMPLVDATVPDYHRVVPQEYTAAVRLDRAGRKALLGALKPLAGDDVVVDVVLGGGGVAIAAAGSRRSLATAGAFDAAFGAARHSVSAELLVHALTAMNGPVDYRVSGVSSPLVLDDGTTQAVVMPVYRQ